MTRFHQHVPAAANAMLHWFVSGLSSRVLQQRRPERRPQGTCIVRYDNVIILVFDPEKGRDDRGLLSVEELTGAAMR
jgi:hypothetical protein